MENYNEIALQLMRLKRINAMCDYRRVSAQRSRSRQTAQLPHDYCFAY